MTRDADALGKSLDGRDELVLPTPMCACRIVGPLGVGSLLADPPLIHKIIGGQVFAVAYCAQHRAAPDLLAALDALTDEVIIYFGGDEDEERSSVPALDAARAAIAKATAAPSNVGRQP